MRICSACGCCNANNSQQCVICGAPLSSPEPGTPPARPTPEPAPISAENSASTQTPEPNPVSIPTQNSVPTQTPEPESVSVLESNPDFASAPKSVPGAVPIGGPASELRSVPLGSSEPSVSLEPSKSRPVPSEPSVSLELSESSESGNADRMAIAGFVLSLMGVATLITSPLQLAALLLSLAARKGKRFRGFRRTGIILSAVALVLSLIFWLVVALNTDEILPSLAGIMYESNY